MKTATRFVPVGFGSVDKQYRLEKAKICLTNGATESGIVLVFLIHYPQVTGLLERVAAN
jgi:hypothetical protein